MPSAHSTDSPHKWPGPRHSGRIKVLVVGSCVYDIPFHVDRIPQLGESLIGSIAPGELGGKGFNQAVALSRLGAEVVFATGLGAADPFAQEFRDAAVREGFEMRADVVPGLSTGLATPMVLPDGDNAILVDPGASTRLSGETVAHLAKDHLIDLVVAHTETSSEALSAGANLARGLGIPFLFSPAPWYGDAVAAHAQKCDILVFNESEAARFISDVTNRSGLEDPADLVCAAADLTAARLTVITLGARGALAYSDGHLLAVPALPITMISDTVGAGDAFTAALGFTLALGLEVVDALKLAAVAGSLACTNAGGAASMPTMCHLLSSVDLNRVVIESTSRDALGAYVDTQR